MTTLELVVDTTLPAANIGDATPDPRTTPVTSLDIVFSEPVYGLDIADLKLTRTGVDVPLTASQTPTTTDHVTWKVPNLSGLTSTAGRYVVTLSAAGSGITDAAGNTLAIDAVEAWTTHSTLAARRIFYNRSAWDGNSAAAGIADDGAIASDKQVLLPGVLASFVNYTSYTRGINGLMLDILNLTGTPTAADFVFRKGNTSKPYGNDLNNPADDWPLAPAPTSITVRDGAGVGGADRVTLIWADNAIQQCWLQVTVQATDVTGLAQQRRVLRGQRDR